MRFVRPARFVERVVWVAIICRLLNDEVSPTLEDGSRGFGCEGDVEVLSVDVRLPARGHGVEPPGFQPGPGRLARDVAQTAEGPTVGTCCQMTALAARADHQISHSWVPDIVPLLPIETDVLEPCSVCVRPDIARPGLAAVQVYDASSPAGRLRAKTDARARCGRSRWMLYAVCGHTRVLSEFSLRCARTCSL